MILDLLNVYLRKWLATTSMSKYTTKTLVYNISRQWSLCAISSEVLPDFYSGLIHVLRRRSASCVPCTWWLPRQQLRTSEVDSWDLLKQHFEPIQCVMHVSIPFRSLNAHTHTICLQIKPKKPKTYRIRVLVHCLIIPGRQPIIRKSFMSALMQRWHLMQKATHNYFK